MAYTLLALQKAFFGESAAAASENGHGPGVLAPISLAEKLGALILMGTSLAVGLYPKVLLDWIVPSFQGPLFEGMRKAGML